MNEVVGFGNSLSLELRPDGVAVITMDDPGAPVNTLKAELAEDFGRLLGELEHKPELKAVVLISGKNNQRI